MQQGFRFETNTSGTAEIVRYDDSRHVVCKFDDTQTIVTTTASQVRNGSVRDPMRRSVFGVGYYGVGTHNIYSFHHQRWLNMLRRCYDETSADWSAYGFRGVTVHDDWHNFQTFATDAETIHGNDYPRWQIDKDILSQTRKIYSVEACCFVPEEINSALQKIHPKDDGMPYGVSFNYDGKYKAQAPVNGKQQYLGVFKNKEDAAKVCADAKETYVWQLAEKYRPELEPRVYAALLEWRLPI